MLCLDYALKRLSSCFLLWTSLLHFIVPLPCSTSTQSSQSKSSACFYSWNACFSPGPCATSHLAATHILPNVHSKNADCLIVFFAILLLLFVPHYRAQLFPTNPSSVQTKQKKETDCLLWCIQVFPAENVQVWRAVLQLTLKANMHNWTDKERSCFNVWRKSFFFKYDSKLGQAQQTKPRYFPWSVWPFNTKLGRISQLLTH